MASPVHCVLLLSLAWGHCASLLEGVFLSKDGLYHFAECIRGSGVQYRGQQQKSSTGSLCLKWNNTSRNYNVSLPPHMDTDVEDHNYCRNPDDSDKPWCYVSGADGQIQREACDIETCQEENCTGTGTCVTSPSGDEEEMTEQVKPVGGAAVQPVVGVSQRVRTGPKKKKDLGVMGYVLAVIMMAIIIILGVGITLGYFYKRGQDLKKQHEQRVYEREMHRITLPLSAFANPTCELVDENTVVVVETQQEAEQAPSHGVVEGRDPLIDSAGTPGA